MTVAGDARGDWTDGAILRESARWIHVPSAGTLVRDGERLLVLLPPREGLSRVWRSRPDRAGAEALILDTIERTRKTGGTRLVWHTGDAVSPPFMDDLLASHGFEKTEDLDVLAFELGADQEPRLPTLSIPPNIHVSMVENAEDLRRAHTIESAVFPSSTLAEPDPATYLEMLSAFRNGTPATAPGRNIPRAFRCLASVLDPVNGALKTVATAGAELADRTLRLWGAGTLPAYRNLGAYRALIGERCRQAHARGATLALTKANASTSSSILKAAGFRAVAKERRHALAVAPQHQGPA